MSRAFVRESDDRPELPMARPISTLPEGAKNYLTSGGARRLRDELRQLIEVERPQATAAASGEPAAQTRLLLLNQRIAQLEQSLQSAEIVGPPEGDRDVVRFGATVTVQRSDGEEDDYRIVGLDEIDLDRGWVSWLSPIARALQNNRVGEHVRFKFPSGEEDLEIRQVRYEDL